MSYGIHKPGQGHWTRLLSFLGGMVMFAWGGAWLAGQLTKVDLPVNAAGETVVDLRFVQFAGGGLLLVLGAALSYWFAYSKARTVEFLISTEGEMKKVNWSTRREVVGSTWVVITVSLLLALSLFLVDLGFSKLFQEIGVLERAG